MNAPVSNPVTMQNPLRTRQTGGGTQEMTDWYLKSETGPLLDVLLEHGLSAFAAVLAGTGLLLRLVQHSGCPRDRTPVRFRRRPGGIGARPIRAPTLAGVLTS